MPLGKYYCDYCDKEFLDTPPARKRHVQGMQHKRARALWYDSIKAEPAGGFLLAQSHGNISQGVCHHFVRTGICKFGDSCKYFHPQHNVLNPAQNVAGTRITETLQPPVFPGNQLPGTNPLFGNSIGDAGISWGNLPPSLRPPPEGGYRPLPFVDWG
ncbi:putative transcription factor C3H family [Dioscorea sansibarensis]